MASFKEHHAQLPDEALEAMIVDLMIPWYISFYVGWRQAPDTLIIRYEDMIANPSDTLRTILERANIKTSPDKIQEALEKVEGKRNRFNKGVAGRGQNLQPETKQKILNLLHFYPEYHDDPFFRDMLNT